MKVLFLQDVENVAKTGQVKEVADGYARNYLLPRKLAVTATPAALREWEQRRQAVVRHEAHTRTQAQALATKLEAGPVVIKAKVGSEDRLYGSVTSANIAAELERMVGEPIDRRQIVLEEPIKAVGSYTVPVKLFRDITATISIVVEPERA